jgi:hypothetical protein
MKFSAMIGCTGTSSATSHVAVIYGDAPVVCGYRTPQNKGADQMRDEGGSAGDIVRPS